MEHLKKVLNMKGGSVDHSSNGISRLNQYKSIPQNFDGIRLSSGSIPVILFQPHLLLCPVTTVRLARIIRCCSDDV